MDDMRVLPEAERQDHCVRLLHTYYRALRLFLFFIGSNVMLNFQRLEIFNFRSSNALAPHDHKERRAEAE